ncbi:hypothetical protein [Paraburkholderia jirisanensis]
MTNRAYIRYILAALIPALWLAYATKYLTPVRVGDGSGYYALYLTRKTTLRPFMSSASWAQYGALFDSNAIQSMVPLRDLVDQFPALRLGDTADLNHFWFFSGLAALFTVIPSGLGIKSGPHGAFLLTHALLFAGVLMLASRLEQWRGLLGVLLLTVCSPMIWFADKVHTEFFTYCFVLAGAIACVNARYFAAVAFDDSVERPWQPAGYDHLRFQLRGKLGALERRPSRRPAVCRAGRENRIDPCAQFRAEWARAAGCGNGQQ